MEKARARMHVCIVKCSIAAWAGSEVKSVMGIQVGEVAWKKMRVYS